MWFFVAQSFIILKLIFLGKVLECVCASATNGRVVLAANWKSDGTSTPVSNYRSPRA